MSKHWEFKHSPIPGGKPETLADVPEGVPCVVEWEEGLYVRMRMGECVINTCNREQHTCSTDYRFVSYIDGHRPSEPKKPERVRDVPLNRCCRVLDYVMCRVMCSDGNQYVLVKSVSGSIHRHNHNVYDGFKVGELLPMVAVLSDDPTGGEQ